VNRRAVLDSATVIELFHRHNILLLEADWTKQDSAITNALAAFGRNSVPLYLFYPAGGGQAIVLPQILTVSGMQNIFKDEEVSK
jgi:thiol:disulfide interchange protein